MLFVAFRYSPIDSPSCPLAVSVSVSLFLSLSLAVSFAELHLISKLSTRRWAMGVTERERERRDPRQPVSVFVLIKKIIVRKTSDCTHFGWPVLESESFARLLHAHGKHGKHGKVQQYPLAAQLPRLMRQFKC